MEMSKTNLTLLYEAFLMIRPGFFFKEMNTHRRTMTNRLYGHCKDCVISLKEVFVDIYKASLILTRTLCLFSDYVLICFLRWFADRDELLSSDCSVVS